MTISAYSTDRVSEILDRSGALNPNSSIRNIKLVRAETKEVLRVDLAKYFVTLNEDLNPYVQGGDNIIVPEISKDITIHISGEIPVKDQDYEFVENDSLSTLIRLAQGFLKSSFLDSVEFIRFNENTKNYEKTVLNLTNWVGKIYNFNEVLDNDFELNPGDRVYIRKNPNWVKLTYIKIDGEVKYPGKYSIPNDNTKIADIINAAGGFTESAAPELSEYIRQEEADLPDFELERLRKISPTDMSESENRYFQARIREKKGLMSVDLENALKNINSLDNIIVENRDSVFIPKKKNYIIVQGRVNSPGAIIYNENMTYLDYIELSGGFGFRADEKETFITKPGGQQFLASEMKYKIEPGDVILVPPQKERDIWPLFLETFTLVTQIITVASVVITLSNSTK
jgi:protein involved in polysaccharide export with SLBB domain